jgi:3-hydroxymyristoyl/3-hydroxydecanoyl-(acyl carrier protein) dehydratase
MTGAGAAGEVRWSLPADHPCLPGHFPGEPVVPGVVVLEAVLAAMGVDAAQPRALAWMKFVRPLLPGQEATIRWRDAGSQWRFEVLCGQQVLASGALARSALAHEAPARQGSAP